MANAGTDQHDAAREPHPVRRSWHREDGQVPSPARAIVTLTAPMRTAAVSRAHVIGAESEADGQVVNAERKPVDQELARALRGCTGGVAAVAGGMPE